MTEMVILVAAAVAAFGLAQRFRLPLIPLLIGCGFLLANVGLVTERANLADALDLGLAFLLFSAGIELNPQRFRRHRQAVWWVAALQFLIVAGIGFVVGLGFGFTAMESLYVATALATSSTLVVVRQLQHRVGARAGFGRLVIGVLFVQDLAMIVLLVMLAQLPAGGWAVVQGLGGVILLAAAAMVVQRWVAGRIIRGTHPDEEALLLLVISLLFLFCALAFWLDLPIACGAFFAGLALSSFPANGVTRGLLRSLTTFFLATFFTALGAHLQVPDFGLLLQVLALVVLVWLITPPLVAAVTEWKSGLTARSAITAGLLLAQTSEFSLVLALYGLQTNALSEDVFALITWVAVLSMTLTPFVATDRIARRLLDWHPGHRRMRRRAAASSAGRARLRDHVIMLGYGSGGSWALKPLQDHGHEVVVIDEDPAVVAQLEHMGLHAVRGDASDEQMLEEVDARHARCVLISLPNPEDAARVAAGLRRHGVTVIARVFEHDHARPVEQAGAIPVLNSLAAADSFMEWFEGLAEEPPVHDPDHDRGENAPSVPGDNAGPVTDQPR